MTQLRLSTAEKFMNFIIEADKIIFKLINSAWSSPATDLIMRFFSILADPVTMWLWVMVLGFVLYSISPDPHAGAGAKQPAASARRFMKCCISIAFVYGVNAGVYKLLKFLVHRPRPFVEQEVILRLSVDGMNCFSSFPSGHAANAFMLAVILGSICGKMRPFIYSAALLIALSRIYLGVHYPLDVTAGACLGASVTWLFLRVRPLRPELKPH